MSSLWSETNLTHRQTVALAYDHLPLQGWIVSPRILNALLSYNHKLTIGDVIRKQANFGDIGGLGASGKREIDIQIATLLDNSEVTTYSGSTDQRYIPSTLPDTIGQLPLKLLHLDMKTYQALTHDKILTIADLYHIESPVLKELPGLHIDSLRNINTALITLVHTIQHEETLDWFTYYTIRNIALLPLRSNNTTSIDTLLKQIPEILEEIFTRENCIRSWTIIQRRFGLGKEKLTLEDVGNAYNITRERVRQIEGKSLALLQTIFFEQNYAGKNYHIHPALHTFLQTIQTMVETKPYKLITETNLLKYAQDTFSIDTEKKAPILFFLLSLIKMEKFDFSYPLFDIAWGYSDSAQHKQIDQTLKRLDRFLTEETSLPHIDFDILAIWLTFGEALCFTDTGYFTHQALHYRAWSTR